MTQQPQPRAITLVINKASVVEGRNGDQYELESKVPWSQYPERFWIDCSWVDQIPRANDLVKCMVSVRDLKDGKDGDHDYDWRWKIDQWGIDAVEAADAPASPRPRPSGQVKDNSSPEEWSRSKPAVTRAPAWEEQPMKADHPSKRRSIERQAALKAAIDYLPDKESAGDLLDVASLFYQWISAAPEATQVPPEAPESVPQPVSPPPDVEGPDVVYDKDGEIVINEMPAIDTIEDFANTMTQLGVTREQVKGALGGKSLTDWIDGRHRTVGAALIRVKNNLGIESL